DLGAALEHAFSPVAKLFSGLGDLMMRSLIKLWNTFVKSSGALSSMLGLETIDPDAHQRDFRTETDRALERSRRLRSGLETDEERAARQALIPGAADIGDFGAGLQLFGEQTAEGIKLLGTAVQS